MSSAKDLVVKPIGHADAAALVKRIHYSGKCTVNSQLHLGVFLNDKLEGAMQFGPSLDKRKMLGIVPGTGWNGFIELNRMAFSDRLPRNSESRALGVAFRMIRKHYPQIEWVISFADGAQCGDGTIYRAAGFVLTQINKNKTLWRGPAGDVIADISVNAGNPNRPGPIVNKVSVTKGAALLASTGSAAGPIGGAASMKLYKEAGYAPIPGFQLRYIYFMNPEARARLAVPIIPFSKIEEMGAGMYRGEKVTRAKEQAVEYPSALGGAAPTRTLHIQEGADHAARTQTQADSSQTNSG